SNWLLCTWIGLTLGQNLPGMSQWGLEVAMIVAFVGIIAPALTSAPMWAAAAAASVCAIVSHDWPHQSGLILSSVIGVATGLLLESRRKVS
ncbi:MAG: AzlC family ABC transporter permease, partial [Endozoicomonas sp.]